VLPPPFFYGSVIPFLPHNPDQAGVDYSFQQKLSQYKFYAAPVQFKKVKVNDSNIRAK
jgi:hypothetical protein